MVPALIKMYDARQTLSGSFWSNRGEIFFKIKTFVFHISAYWHQLQFLSDSHHIGKCETARQVVRNQRLPSDVGGAKEGRGDKGSG